MSFVSDVSSTAHSRKKKRRIALRSRPSSRRLSSYHVVHKVLPAVFRVESRLLNLRSREKRVSPTFSILPRTSVSGGGRAGRRWALGGEGERVRARFLSIFLFFYLGFVNQAVQRDHDAVALGVGALVGVHYLGRPLFLGPVLHCSARHPRSSVSAVVEERRRRRRRRSRPSESRSPFLSPEERFGAGDPPAGDISMEISGNVPLKRSSAAG